MKGPSLDMIRPVAERIQQQIAQVPNTVDVRIKQGKSYPELHIDVDRTKAAYYGINQNRVVVDVITGISSNLAPRLTTGSIRKPRTGISSWRSIPEQSLTTTEDLLNIPSSARARRCWEPPVSPAAGCSARPSRCRTRRLPGGRWRSPAATTRQATTDAGRR